VFAIIIFAIIVRMLMFPLSLWAQYESIKLANLKPYMDDIKNYGGSDWRGVRRQTKALYKRERYRSISTMLPLILQLPIITGVMRAFGDMAALSDTPGEPILPILAALSAFALCVVQNKCNVLAKQMRFFSKWGFAIFLTAFSLFFAITSSEGFGVFWVFGNLAAIVAQLLCNWIYNPKKMVRHEILPLDKFDWKLWRLRRTKQREDVKRFYAAKKELVFYSEKSGFYKYFRPFVEYILKNSNIHVHYLTSDIDDQVFKKKHPRFHAYYCGPHKMITVFMKMDCKVCVMTVPCFHKYQYKRSLVREVEYVYIDHGFGSQTMVLEKDPFKYYDTVFCYGPNYNEELRVIEQFYGSKEKSLVDVGFPLFEELREKYAHYPPNEKKTVIIAPSWQKDNILDYCLDDLMAALSKTDYNVVLRPHPEYIKRFPLKIKALRAKYDNELQLDFQKSILSADILITDWSTVAYEFSYATNRPSVFINTPMKVLNPDWEKYGIEPIDITLRDKIGVAVDVEDIGTIDKALVALKQIKNPRAQLKKLLYDVSNAAEVGGGCIIKAVRRKKQK